MPGWGERKGPSEELVRKAEQLRRADTLASVVAEFLASHKTGDEDRVRVALNSYRASR